VSALHIFLFGHLRITHDGCSSEVMVAPAIQPLLAFLLLNRHRTHSREKLADLFWGDHKQDRARCCLRTALWRLRRLFEAAGIHSEAYLMTSPTGEISFDQESDYWLDVAAFEEQSVQVLAQSIHATETADIQRLENALELYTGELLENLYDDWVLWERERLQRLYLNGLAYLLHYYKYHSAYEKSLEYGHKILFHDPLREEIHREIMELHLKNGQRALAVQQYETCRNILASELDIQPMEETQAAYARITSESKHLQSQHANSNPTCVQQAIQQVHLSMQSLKNAQQQLQRAIDLIEHA
jgi:DNA-binding SARP family transcriptional activator